MPNTISQFDHKIKYSIALWGLFFLAVMSTIAHIIHWHQMDYFAINRIGSAMNTAVNLYYFLRLYRNPQELEKLLCHYLIIVRAFLILSSWGNIYVLTIFPDLRLVETYPPFTTPAFLWIALLVMVVPYHHLRWYMLLGCLPLSLPVLIYLLAHPTELATARGTDLFISNGLMTIAYIILSSFYAKLQVNYHRLLSERLTYFSKIIQEQDIRQEAIADTFSQLHNGALQTLALLRRNVSDEDLSPQEIQTKLTVLDEQIRILFHDWEPQKKYSLGTFDDSLEDSMNFYFAGNVSVDLSLPFHHLIYEIYRVTLNRDFPYFASLKVKVRSFDPLENDCLSLDVKRNICLWLEEALCNVGKYAKGATKLETIGTYEDGKYYLRVKDNGQGLNHERLGQGTQQGQAIAKKLKGEFTRKTLSNGGVNCQLSWPT